MNELTRQQNLILQLALDIREDPAIEVPNGVGFSARDLIINCLPHRNPRTNEWVRQNGKYKLTIISPSDIGIPYGTYPRLILAYITQQVLRTKSKNIKLGKSFIDFLHYLDISPSSGRHGTIHYVWEQLMKLLSSSITFQVNEKNQYGETDYLYFPPRIAEKAIIHWRKSSIYQRNFDESEIELSDGFFESLLKHPVIFDMRALKAIRQSSLAIDIYLWTTYKSRICEFTGKDLYLPWKNIKEQFGGEYKDNKYGRYAFKKYFKEALAKVEIVYPELKVRTTRVGLYFERETRPHIPSRTRKPG